MAASQSTVVLHPAFSTVLDACLSQQIEFVDRVMNRAYECHDAACPILGSHNTDECADLIAQAKKEGSL